MIFNLAITLGVLGLVEVTFLEMSMRIIPSQLLRVTLVVLGATAIQGMIGWSLGALGLPNDAVKFSSNVKIDWKSLNVSKGDALAALSTTVWCLATIIIMLPLFVPDAQKILVRLPDVAPEKEPLILAFTFAAGWCAFGVLSKWLHTDGGHPLLFPTALMPIYVGALALVLVETGTMPVSWVHTHYGWFYFVLAFCSAFTLVVYDERLRMPR